jgi:hypothetical protein
MRLIRDSRVSAASPEGERTSGTASFSNTKGRPQAAEVETIADIKSSKDFREHRGSSTGGYFRFLFALEDSALWGILCQERSMVFLEEAFDEAEIGAGRGNAGEYLRTPHLNKIQTNPVRKCFSWRTSPSKSLATP